MARTPIIIRPTKETLKQLDQLTKKWGETRCDTVYRAIQQAYDRECLELDVIKTKRQTANEPQLNQDLAPGKIRK